MRLIHFSAEPHLGPLYSVTQIPAGHMKPRGLWVSDESTDDGWASWCVGEDFGLDRLAHAYEVHLADDATVLTIAGADELDAFTNRFRIDRYDHESLRSIDWGAVSVHWQGIIITPYLWSRRLANHTFWYYGWDCASGCIWDVSAIASVEQVELVLPVRDTG